MHFSIRFKTRKFDVDQERKNPTNPIYGESMLLWIRDRLAGKYDIPVPEAEDWGWYTFVNWQGRSYMLGASAEKESDGSCDWFLQVVKQRTFKEKLFRKEKMTKDDGCLHLIESSIEAESEFTNIHLE